MLRKTAAASRVRLPARRASMRPQRNAAENATRATPWKRLLIASMRPQRNAAENNGAGRIVGSVRDWLQ